MATLPGMPGLGALTLPSLQLPTTRTSFDGSALWRTAETGAILQRLRTKSAENAFTLSQMIGGGADVLRTGKFQHYFRGIEVLGSETFVHETDAERTTEEALQEFDLDTRPTVTLEDATSLTLSLEPGTLVTRQPELKILTDPTTREARLIYWVTTQGTATRAGRQVILDARTGETLVNASTHIDAVPIRVHTTIGRTAGVTPQQLAQVIDRKTCRMVNPASCRKDARTGKILVETCTQVDPSSCDLDQAKVPAAWNQACQVTPSQPGSMPLGYDIRNCTLVANNAQSLTQDVSVRRAATNAAATLAYFQRTHGWNSYDNKGSPLVSLVHAGVKMSNAFWDSQAGVMAYGDGDGVNSGDFTLALDVAGHEMTHGVVSSTARLLPGGEAGALNEAYADFFGLMIANESWILGQKLALRQGAPGLRDLSNPNRLKTQYRSDAGQVVTVPYPAHVSQKLRTARACSDENDRCWVHANATIAGHASYQLTLAIGRPLAERIIFATLTRNLPRNADFAMMGRQTRSTCAILSRATQQRNGITPATCAKVNEALLKVGV